MGNVQFGAFERDGFFVPFISIEVEQGGTRTIKFVSNVSFEDEESCEKIALFVYRVLTGKHHNLKIHGTEIQ